MNRGVEPVPGFEWIQREWHQDMLAIMAGKTRYSEALDEEVLARHRAYAKHMNEVLRHKRETAPGG